MSSEPSLIPISLRDAPLLYGIMVLGVDISICSPTAVRYIGYGDTPYGYGPICLFDVDGTEFVAEPHVTWLPWVTPRIKIESFKWAIKQLYKTHQVFLTVEKKETPFFEHFARKGFLRRVGHLEDLPTIGELHMYQYKGAN